jgi:hypothetical protein
MDAQLRYYYRLTQREVDALDDEAWAMHWQDLVWLRQQEAKGRDNAGGGT